VVDILEHNVLGLQHQIEGLLSVNASLPDRGPQVRRPVALRAFLYELVRRRELHSQARALRLRIEVPEKTVTLDAEKLAVIVDNLLSNAIDFSPESGEISVRATLVEGSLCLDVIDQGPGIAPEDVDRIFEPFVQGRRSASIPRQGSGVGLSIVRELVRALGGAVHVVPAAAGAHLRVELPHD
jgi:two-component system sensor histidine kinase GlrK